MFILVLYVKKMGVSIFIKDTMKAFFSGYNSSIFAKWERFDKKKWNHTYKDMENDGRFSLWVVPLKEENQYTFSNGIIFDINDLFMIPSGSSLRDILVGGMYLISLINIYI